MKPRRFALPAVALAAIMLAGAVRLATDIPIHKDPAILGLAPTYGPAQVAAVPNAAAIGTRIWVPHLDSWYTPQGLTAISSDLFVAAYRSETYSVHRGPCRVFRLDPASGAETGGFDVPAPCGHAGGLAYDGRGRVYVADTHTLFITDLAAVLAGGPAAFRTVPLGGGVIGALAASDDGAIWLGTHREDGPGQLYRFTAATIDGLPPGAELTPAQASLVLAGPAEAQGAALDGAGKLWIAASGGSWGTLDRFDLTTGAAERHDEMPPGIEGIAFDPQGRLWAVSEAGARHYYDQPVIGWFQSFYPLVFTIDPARLH